MPFPIGVFGGYGTNIFITTNGVISINQGSIEWRETTLPADVLPDVSILAYWDDLLIYPGTPQGIYYEITGTAPNRKVTFEFYHSHYLDNLQYFHFAMEFYEAQQGVTLFKYYEVGAGTTFGNGRSATVGAQRKSTNQFMQYSFRQPVILPNTFVRLDTVAGITTNGNL